MEARYSKWRKLDNAALAFPLVTGKDDTRVFRFYAELKEEVQEELLQEALDETMKIYPLFQAVLRKGVFWFYLEHRDIRAVVKKEKKPPCSRLYIPDKKSLLFEVSYYKNRINFEVYHALTDGTGAMHFLRQLVSLYVRKAHPEAGLPEILDGEEATGADQEEDSFSQYYSSKGSKKREPHPAAVKLKGEKVAHEDMHITELVLPVGEIHKKAKSQGVSITIYLAAALLWAIHEEVPVSRQKKPIALMIPVNLRNYFPSQSMTNFFGWIEVGYRFGEETVFPEVLESVKEQFAKELDKERLAASLNGFVGLEKNPLIRAVPLEIKRYFLMAGARLGSRSITAVYSNIGILRFPESYGPYLEKFGIFASTDALQLCSCSYGDQMVLGFTSKMPDDSIQRNFQQLLKKEEVSVREEKNDFPGCQTDYRKADKKILQSFTFVCIAVAVICSMINYMMDDALNWSWFAIAGCTCAWLVVSVAYKKRRNILKNEMLQLILVTLLGVGWDLYTGWHGWSLDFLFPFGALAVLGSIPVIAKVRHLEQAEYLFYLIQAAMAGCIPAVLVWTGLVHIHAPSIFCAGISFLVLAGLFLFQQKDTLREFRTKLRM